MKLSEVRKNSKITFILAEIPLTYKKDFNRVVKILKEHIHVRLFHHTFPGIDEVDQFVNKATRFLELANEFGDYDSDIVKIRDMVSKMLAEIEELKSKL